MLSKIEAMLRDHVGNPDLKITEDTTFAELNLDSLDTVDLVMSMEDEFGITIEMDENVKTIGELLAIIQAAS